MEHQREKDMETRVTIGVGEVSTSRNITWRSMGLSNYL